MSLQIIAGGAASGKSNRLVSEMAARSVAFPDERFFIIVPEQATLNMQQSVVAHLQQMKAGNDSGTAATMNIDVVSFDRLAHVVFADLGIDASNILDDTGKVLILRQVLEEMKDDLEVYKNKVHLPGFTQRIKSQVTELKQYGIDDNTLFLMQESAQAGQNRLLYAKLQDLRLISRKFDERIRDAYRFAEELLVLFAECVPRSDRIRASHIYLDGFTGFTPVQLKLLSQFLRYAADVTVSVTLPEEKIRENCPEYDLFHLSNQTWFKLSELAAEAKTQVLPPIFVKAEKEEQLSSCGIYKACDLQDEAVFTAKEILRLVRDEGYRYRDIAVIVSDMEAYHEAAESVFQEAKIPCFIDHKSQITDNPLSRYVLAALALSEQRFSYESVFAYLKTGLTDLSFNEICRMDNYCLEFGIRGIRAWYEDMQKNRKLHGPEPLEEELKEDAYAGQAWNLDEINAIREKVLESIRGFYREISRKELTAADLSGALLRLLEKNRIREKIEQKAELLREQGRIKEQREYAQVFEQVKDLLEKTALLSGKKTLSVKEFRMLLESGLSEIKVGVIPPTMDMLTVGDLTRTRLDHVKVLFLMGANNGKIPSASDPAGVLSSRDREFLKTEHFELAPTMAETICNQKFYLYLMLNKPTDKLYITCALKDAAGEELEPSYILEELPELVTKMTERQELCAPDIKWERQALRKLAARFRKEPEESLLRYFANEDPFVVRQILDAAFYSNAQTALDQRVALDLYGDVLSGSVSRYEKFSECPFKQFLSYGIRLEKRPEYEIAATDAGTIYHNALEIYSGALKDAGYSYRNVPDEESRRIAKESIKEALDAMPSDVLDSSYRNAFFVKRITDVTLKTTDVLREQVKAGLYEPDAFELEFRQTLNENVKFKGKIDRVDIYDADDIYIKIIDYKSGSKEFKIADIYSGLQLQLVAYLKEAIDLYGKENPGREIKAGGVYYYRINDHFTKDEKEAQNRFRLSGLTSCEDGMIRAVDSSLGTGGASESTIIPVSCKKDGEPTERSLIANSSEFQNLMEFVGGKIETISTEIRNGNIAIRPYYAQERENACSFCDYKNVCKFEAGCFGLDWNLKPEKTKKEMEAEIYGRV